MPRAHVGNRRHALSALRETRENPQSRRLTTSGCGVDLSWCPPQEGLRQAGRLSTARVSGIATAQPRNRRRLHTRQAGQWIDRFNRHNRQSAIPGGFAPVRRDSIASVLPLRPPLVLVREKKGRSQCRVFDAHMQAQLALESSRFAHIGLLSIRQVTGAVVEPMMCDESRRDVRVGSRFDLLEAVMIADAHLSNRHGRVSANTKAGNPPMHTRVVDRVNGSSAGFTFVELLIVVAIVSILAAIALPAYRDYVLRSKVAESLILLSDARIAVNDFHSRWGRMPADNREAGLRQPDDLRGNYVRSLSIRDGVMVALMDLGRDSDQQPIIRTLTFRPWLNMKASDSPIIWSCGQQDPGVSDAWQAQGHIAANPVEKKLLPSTCRD